MRRTILSENQYDPKFMTTAKTNAIMRPWPPPASSPMTSRSPLNSPRSIAVLNTLAISQLKQLQGVCCYLFYRVQSFHQCRQESGAPRQVVHDDVLVQRMCTITFRAETV